MATRARPWRDAARRARPRSAWIATGRAIGSGPPSIPVGVLEAGGRAANELTSAAAGPEIASTRHGMASSATA
jgi:hypothetical protein